MSSDPAPTPTSRDSHPLAYAARGLIRDLLSTIAFLVVFEVTGRLAVAVAWGVTIGVGQVAYRLFKRKPIDRMQWLSLFLVVAFGAASLLTGNFLFYKLKFTLIYVAIGAVTLVPGWMNAYVPPVARDRASDVNTTFGFIWSGLFFMTAALNLGLATLAKPSIWAWFIGVFPIASKATLAISQYIVTRHIVRQRLREQPAS